MINVANKSTQFFKATSQVVSNGLKPLVLSSAAVDKVPIVESKGNPITSYSLQKALAPNNIRVSSGPAGKEFYMLIVVL